MKVVTAPSNLSISLRSLSTAPRDYSATMSPHAKSAATLKNSIETMLPMTTLGRSSSLPSCLKPRRTRPKPKKRASLDDNDTAAAVQRRSVRFAPLPPGKVAKPHHKGKGYREDYVLGDKAKKLSHMLCHRGPGQAFQLVNSLKCRDFAFVRRPCGGYVYSILACRSLEPPKDTTNSSPETLDECMIFVLSEAGSIVKLRKDEWIENLRLVATEEIDPPCSKKALKDQWTPPDIISFVPDSADKTSLSA